VRISAHSGASTTNAGCGMRHLRMGLTIFPLAKMESRQEAKGGDGTAETMLSSLGAKSKPRS
jgi:hypothetical protein